MSSGTLNTTGSTLIEIDTRAEAGLTQSPWRGLILFFTFTYALTWLLWLPRILHAGGALDLPSSVERVLNYSANMVPSLVAIGVTLYLRGFDGLRALLSLALRWRFHPVYYVLSVVGLGLLYLIGLALYTATGGDAPDQWLRLPGIVTTLILLQIAIGEEFGWRGFALPRLLPRTGTLGASLVLGLLWTLWHLPNFFVPESNVFGTPFTTVLIELTALCVLYTWLVVRSNSLIPAILFHWTQNLWFIMVPSPPEAAWTRMLLLVVAAIAAIVTLPRPLFGGRNQSGIEPGLGL